MSAFIILIAGGAAAARATQASDPAPAAFDYDARLPLALEVTGVQQRDGVTVQDITYASPKGQRVTAFLVVPPGEGRFAGIIYLHWGFGDRREFLSEAIRTSREGAVCLLIDAPWARPEPWRHEGEGHVTQPEIDRDLYVRTVIDLRRAVDLLNDREDVDTARIGFVGHSFGATWGGALAGVERRIRTYVLMAGLPTLIDFQDDAAPRIAEINAMIRSKFSQEQIRKYAETLDPIMPERFVGGAAPASILFQWATHDVFISPKAAQRYFSAAAEPKSQRTYFCDHSLNDPESRSDRLRWLERGLGLQPSTSPRAGAGHGEECRDGDRVSRLECQLRGSPGHGGIFYALAQANAASGRPREAVHRLSQALDSGVDVDLDVPAFAPLRELPEFQALGPKAAARRVVAHKATPAFAIPERDLIPENVAYDPVQKAFFAGSTHKRKILRIDPERGVTDFVPAGRDGLWQVLGMKVDAPRRALWVASEADQTAGAQDGNSGLFLYDLGTGRLAARHVLDNCCGPHLFNDLVLDGDGNVYVTDSREGCVYVLRRGSGTLERLVPAGSLSYPNGIALDPGGHRLFVADESMGLSTIDLIDRRQAPLRHPDDVSVHGIDGLYAYEGGLVAVQNGAGAARVVRFLLSAAGERIEGVEVLESHNSLFNVPTTGVVVGADFYVIANSQLDAVDPEGRLRPDAQLQETFVLRIPLP